MRLGQALGDPHTSGFSKRRHSVPQNHPAGWMWSCWASHEDLRAETTAPCGLHGHVQVFTVTGDALGTWNSKVGSCEGSYGLLGWPALRALPWGQGPIVDILSCLLELGTGKGV